MKMLFKCKRIDLTGEKEFPIFDTSYINDEDISGFSTLEIANEIEVHIITKSGNFGIFCTVKDIDYAKYVIRFLNLIVFKPEWIKHDKYEDLLDIVRENDYLLDMKNIEYILGEYYGIKR